MSSSIIRAQLLLNSLSTKSGEHQEDEHGTGLAAEWEADPEQTARRFLDQHFSQEKTPYELTSRWGNLFLYHLTVSEETGR
jgi:hypothetical protein